MSQTIRNIYDCQRAGALRATADGVTGNPILRVNITFSSTPDAARTFYKKDMTNGFFGRIPFVYKARGERSGKIPRQGQYDEEFLKNQAVRLLLKRIAAPGAPFAREVLAPELVVRASASPARPA